MKPVLSIIVVSWNNPDDLNPCVASIMRTGVLDGPGELIIVNNGDFPLKDQFVHPRIKVIDTGENLGWERGLERGLKESEAPYVCFQNDDTVIPVANRNFYLELLNPFHDPRIAAVGPTTTVASGRHSIFQQNPPTTLEPVSYLIFFTVMIERKSLDAAGGVDTSAPGGDDFDLSIRLRRLGKHLVITPNAFLIHHGYRSGTRLHGDHTKVGGWNSKQMTDRTNQWLIQKHGFRAFIETQWGKVDSIKSESLKDSEGEAIRAIVPRETKVLELGCGGQKTVEWAIGVDRVAKGEVIPHVGVKSVADLVGDVSGVFDDSFKAKYDFVIARHILEHCVDTISTVKEWASLVKPGGSLVIAVPNQDLGNSIPMNPEHVHAFTPESLRMTMEACGLTQESVTDPKNGVSFIGVYGKHLNETKTVSSALEAALA